MDTVWRDKLYMAFRLCPFSMTIHSFPDMSVLDVNEAYERKTGLRREEVNREIPGGYHWDDAKCRCVRNPPPPTLSRPLKRKGPEARPSGPLGPQGVWDMRHPSH
jgi:hypothetical protein